MIRVKSADGVLGHIRYHCDHCGCAAHDMVATVPLPIDPRARASILLRLRLAIRMECLRLSRGRRLEMWYMGGGRAICPRCAGTTEAY